MIALAIVLIIAFLYLTNADLQLKIGNKVIEVYTSEEGSETS